MKPLFKIPFTLFVLTLLFSCASNRLNQTQKQLVINFINNTEIEQYKTSGKIPILKTEYCDEANCESFFKGYEQHIVFYTKADMFMRAMHKFVEIEEISKKNNKITALLKDKADSKVIEIGL
jgi:hypothetical protein